MKKITFITIALLILSNISYSQYSEKQLRTLKKMELKIINRGLNLNDAFVPYTEIPVCRGCMELWSDSMSAVGLEVGDYSKSTQIKDAKNREVVFSNLFKGRYVFELKRFGPIKIFDLKDNNKIVVTISYKGSISFNAKYSYKREYVLKKLIESNKK